MKPESAGQRLRLRIARIRSEALKENRSLRCVLEGHASSASLCLSFFVFKPEGVGV